MRSRPKPRTLDSVAKSAKPMSYVSPKTISPAQIAIKKDIHHSAPAAKEQPKPLLPLKPGPMHQKESMGSDVYVYRAGKLVPLSSVIKKRETKAQMEKENAELIYVYDAGKLVILGGSLCHLDPSQSKNVRARVVLPLGLTAPTRPLADKMVESNVQAVYIDEKLARFALTALTKPTQFTNNKLSKIRRWDGPRLSKYLPRKTIINTNNNKKNINSKSSSTFSSSIINKKKSSILDIISAKLALSDDSAIANTKLGHGSDHGLSTIPSAVKAEASSANTRNSRLYIKNLHRFPSLSREMKRLDVNYVNIANSKVCNCLR